MGWISVEEATLYTPAAKNEVETVLVTCIIKIYYYNNDME